MEDFSLDQLAALAALAEAGTTGRAALALRITQSAVSKRIAALEARAGVRLVEAEGRRVVLTPAARELLDGALPLLAQLRDVVAGAAAARRKLTLRVGASESLLSSWLPRVLHQVADRIPDVTLELHAHRGPVLLDRVRSGEHALAICVDAGEQGDLVTQNLGEEAMVIVPSALRPLPRAVSPVPVLAIEERSLTWQALELRLRSRRARIVPAIAVVGRLESFTALAQVARAGFGHALVPRGVAESVGLRARDVVRLQGLARPLAAFVRPTLARRDTIALFLRELARAWPKG